MPSPDQSKSVGYCRIIFRKKKRKKVVAYLMFLARGRIVSRDFVSPFWCCKEQIVVSAFENEAKEKGADM